MDNKRLWILTAQNVVKFCRVSTASSDNKKRPARKMKVRQASEKPSRNISVTVTN